MSLHLLLKSFDDPIIKKANIDSLSGSNVGLPYNGPLSEVSLVLSA